MAAAPLDDAVLRAAADVVAQHGWHELTLERVATAAGVSRVTLYRRGVTKQVLGEALAARAAQGWQAAIWPALTGEGTAAERLREALRLSCAAVEDQLPLLAGLGTTADPSRGLDALPTSGHTGAAAGTGDVYVAPFARLLRDGAADGSLAPQADPVACATALFTMAPRTYLHLRGTHQWAPARAVEVLTSMLLDGLLPRPPSQD